MYPEETERCLSEKAVYVDQNPTIEENINTKINMLKKEIERLESSKIELKSILKMRIRDIRDAMSY